MALRRQAKLDPRGSMRIDVCLGVWSVPGLLACRRLGKEALRAVRDMSPEQSRVTVSGRVLLPRSRLICRKTFQEEWGTFELAATLVEEDEAAWAWVKRADAELYRRQGGLLMAEEIL